MSYVFSFVLVFGQIVLFIALDLVFTPIPANSKPIEADSNARDVPMRVGNSSILLHLPKKKVTNVTSDMDWDSL